MIRIYRPGTTYRPFWLIVILGLLLPGPCVYGQMPGWPPMPDAAFRTLLSGDPAGFVIVLQDRAQEGDVPSMFYLGRAYEGVEGVRHDFVEAQKWYRMAAEHGSGPGAWSLGCLYEKGKGVLADRAESQRWFLRASELGYRRTALVVSYVRWYPGPEPLKQTVPGPSHLAVQLSPEELTLLKNAGTSGRLEVQGGSVGESGVPARLIIVARTPVKNEVKLALPVEKSLIYRQDEDAWKKIPGDAHTGDKKVRLAPQDPNHLESTMGTLENEDGSESGGPAFVWR